MKVWFCKSLLKENAMRGFYFLPIIGLEVGGDLLDLRRRHEVRVCLGRQHLQKNKHERMLFNVYEVILRLLLGIPQR